MGLLHFLEENWFTLLQTSGIIGGLLLNAAALKADAKSRRVTNLINLTSQHRDIWTRYDDEPSLARVLDAEVNLVDKSVTRQEEDFTRTVILHLNSAFHALRAGMLMKPDGLHRDMQSFFALPIPKAVWERLKPFQDDDFVQFVERAIKDGGESNSTRRET